MKYKQVYLETFLNFIFQNDFYKILADTGENQILDWDINEFIFNELKGGVK